MRNRIRPTLTVAIPGVPPIPANASAVNTSENSCQPSPVPAILEHEGRQPTVQVHDPVSGDVNAVVARTAHTHQEVFGGERRCGAASRGAADLFSVVVLSNNSDRIGTNKIEKCPESFALVTKMIKNKFQINIWGHHRLHGELSGTPGIHLGVQESLLWAEHL